VSHQTAGSPGFHIKDTTTCTRSMTAKRQPITSTAVYGISSMSSIPSPSLNKVSMLKWRSRSSLLGLWFPLSKLNSTPYDAKPMTRGVLAVCLPYQVEDFHPWRPPLRSYTDLSRRTGCFHNLLICCSFERNIFHKLISSDGEKII
jgi:hypothetical protein